MSDQTERPPPSPWSPRPRPPILLVDDEVLLLDTLPETLGILLEDRVTFEVASTVDQAVDKLNRLAKSGGEYAVVLKDMFFVTGSGVQEIDLRVCATVRALMPRTPIVHMTAKLKTDRDAVNRHIEKCSAASTVGSPSILVEKRGKAEEGGEDTSVVLAGLIKSLAFGAPILSRIRSIFGDRSSNPQLAMGAPVMHELRSIMNDILHHWTDLDPIQRGVIDQYFQLELDPDGDLVDLVQR